MNIDENKLANALISGVSGFCIICIIGCLLDITIIQISTMIFVVIAIIADIHTKIKLKLSDIIKVAIIFIGIIMGVFFNGYINWIGNTLSSIGMSLSLIDFLYDYEDVEKELINDINNKL